MEPLRVVLEEGDRRSFASALDWPGWSRSARTGEAAVAQLVAYAPRYREVAERAGLPWPGSRGGLGEPVVVEHLPGTAGTRFGVPDVIAEAERGRPDGQRSERMAALVAGAWAVLDDVAATSPAELRKGPRGGGRDRDPMLAHVLGAEAAYGRRLGLSIAEPGIGDGAAIQALRGAILEVIRSGKPVPNPRRRLWPVPYAARRIAWHVLDHAWEMQDRRD